MRPRKTIEVEQIKRWANGQLLRTDDYATDVFKSGVCTLLEEVLLRSGNYRGFMFECEGDVPRPHEKGYYQRKYF